MGEYDEHAYREKWADAITLISGQFIYLIVIVFRRQLDDALLLLRESCLQLQRLQWERWLQVRASGYHRRRTRTSQWREDQTVANLL